MRPRRDWIFDQVRHVFRRFVDDEGRWQHPPAVRNQPDPRVLVQVTLPFLLGTEADRSLALKLVQNPLVHERLLGPGRCAFSIEYALAVLFAGGDAVSGEVRKILLEGVGQDLLHYASTDLRHHGYNDNHVTLATGTLILGGQLTGNAEAVEEGRANLLNFRDTFLRRGFMHEMNDCYIPHSLYPIAAVAEWAEDAEIRQLALDCEARIWIDWIGHWHVNLARKLGPSARDYTSGRLHPLHSNTVLWTIFGDRFGQPVFPPADSFTPAPPERAFAFNGYPSDGHWNLGFFSRMAAHPYHIPEEVGALMYERTYPHVISGTHEVGNFIEMVRIPNHPHPQSAESIVPDSVPFGGREIYTYQYQEADWGMGTASQRMIGSCPNNNWSISYRKAAPLERTADQGMIFCSMTVNDKACSGDHTFVLNPLLPTPQNREQVEHWHDTGRYAAMQHERTSLLLYRPRVFDRHHLESVATSVVFPFTFGNSVERMDLGDRRISDFQGESLELDDLFIEDGPLRIAIRPLVSRNVPADVRVRFVREKYWGLVHFYTYRGPALNLAERDLCRLGGGFICEVALRSEHKSMEDFKAWFRRGEVIDQEQAFMRHVHYHRAGLDLGLRWDEWADTIVLRSLNGAAMPTPKFQCSGLEAARLPWMAGSFAGLDHVSWLRRQANRTRSNWPDIALNLTPAEK